MFDKLITVTELKESLEILESLGHGNDKLIYLDDNDMEHDIRIGVHDYYSDENIVVIG
jgi:hypothetical protein